MSDAILALSVKCTSTSLLIVIGFLPLPSFLPFNQIAISSTEANVPSSSFHQIYPLCTFGLFGRLPYIQQQQKQIYPPPFARLLPSLCPSPIWSV
jgi:hypothetical protein